MYTCVCMYKCPQCPHSSANILFKYTQFLLCCTELFVINVSFYAFSLMQPAYTAALIHMYLCAYVGT